MAVWLCAMGNMSSTNAHRERPTGIAIKSPPSSFTMLMWKKLQDLRSFQLPLAACPDWQLMRRCQCQALWKTAAGVKGVKVLLKL